jgi:hypothetical protein
MLNEPAGYIRIWYAAGLLRSRMFGLKLSESLLAAALENVEKLKDANFHGEIMEKGVELKNEAAPPDETLTTLVSAITAGELTLFAMTEKSTRVYALAPDIAVEVLDRTGFWPKRLETIGLRLRKMIPITFLQDLRVGALRRAGAETFALVFRESEFDSWMGRTASQNDWPIDRKPRRRVGRPDRVSEVMPLVKIIIESGRWEGGHPFKQLASLVNAKLEQQEVSRGTVERALAKLYDETRDRRYHHKRRSRQPR